MKHFRRHVISASMIAILCLSLSACAFSSKGPAITDEKGNAMKYSLSELTNSGFYVANKEEQTFTPIMSGGKEGGNSENALMSLIPSDNDEDSYIWAGSKNTDPFKLIPTVDGVNTQLIMYQAKQNDMPEEYILSKYKYLGHTIGVEFTFGDTGTDLFIDAQKVCDSSMAKEVLESASASNELLKVYKINNSKELPVNNVDTKINILLGLEKNKKYKVEFFDGTNHIEEDFIADTAVFKKQKDVVLNDPLDVTEYSFFYIKLPQTTKNGYYVINGEGLFKFKGQDTKKDIGNIEEEETK